MTIDDVKLSEEGRFLPWGKVAAEKLQKVEDWIAGGGGNPNSVQTITGTLADPFTDWTDTEYGEFLEAYYTGGASASMVCDASAIGFADDIYLILNPSYIEPSFETSHIGDTSAIVATVDYFGSRIETPYLSEAKVLQASGLEAADPSFTITDISAYASLIPTTLTIIWHPLPESEESGS